MTMLNLTKTKNSSAKRRVMNGLVIETVESVVTGPVLMISLHESPALAAVDDAAAPSRMGFEGVRANSRISKEVFEPVS